MNAFWKGRLILAALVCSACLGLAYVPGSEADNARSAASPCQPAGTKTTLATARARLFTRDTSATRGGSDERLLFGCRSGNRPVRMASRYSGAAAEHFFGSERLQGRYASVITSGTDRGDEAIGEELRVYDLKARRRTAFVSVKFTAFFDDVELRESGSVAYIVRFQVPPFPDPDGDDPDAQPSFNLKVVKREGGKTTELDRGPAIGSDSLALSGSTLYWRNGTEAKTAQLR